MGEKLKIAMLGQKRVPSHEGGIEIVVEELSTRMAAKGHDVTLYNRGGHHVSGKEFDSQKLTEYKSVKLKSVPTIDRKGLAAVSSSFFGALRAAFGKYDVVHFHAEGPCAFMWIPKLFGKRCVATVHGLDWQREKWKGGFGSKFIHYGEKQAVKQADEIIVLSKGMQDYFLREYGRETVLIPNGVNKPEVVEAKARKLEKWCPRLYGHAGLFSTAADMGKFASMMLSGNLLDSQFVNKIGVNHTGKKNEDGTFSQFHGLLCYSKNPVAKNSEVNHWLSGNAFALGGYTGNQLTIDYRNQLYIFMASNRCHNRITSVSGMDIVYEAGMTLEWPDGKRYICNKGYAFDRDESVINPAIELAMKWRFLEWLLGSESKVIRC